MKDTAAEYKPTTLFIRCAGSDRIFFRIASRVYTPLWSAYPFSRELARLDFTTRATVKIYHLSSTIARL